MASRFQLPASSFQLCAWPCAREAFRGRGITALLCAALVTTACGKKGPPLAPLRLVPGPVSELSMRRVGSEVQLRFALPTANLNAPGRIDLERIEVYAVTVAPGAATPPNRDLLTKTYAVGTIAVKPAPIEGEPEPAPGVPPDLRPAPGDRVTFVEQLTAERLKPAPLPLIPVAPALPAARVGEAAAAPVATAPPAGEPAITNPPAVPPASAPTAEQPDVPAGPPVAPGLPPAAGAPPAIGTPPPPEVPAAAEIVPPPAPAATDPVRVYAIRGISRSGRPGQPSERITLPLVTLPATPTAASATFTEKAVTLTWTTAEGAANAAPIGYNVYRDAADATPLNPAPLTTPAFEQPAPEVGTEQCFVVRGVRATQKVTIEGEPGPRACVTWQDTFPPAAPRELSVLLLAGAIELVWDANSEADIAGYTVLRGEAPGDTLRALTPSPIRETTFRDTTVKPGVRYIYALIAVDRAGNASPQSSRAEGTAR